MNDELSGPRLHEAHFKCPKGTCGWWPLSECRWRMVHDLCRMFYRVVPLYNLGLVLVWGQGGGCSNFHFSP